MKKKRSTRIFSDILANIQQKNHQGEGIPLLSLALCIIFKSIMSDVASISGNFLAQ
jgi:hypothetical protein